MFKELCCRNSIKGAMIHRQSQCTHRLDHDLVIDWHHSVRNLTDCQNHRGGHVDNGNKRIDTVHTQVGDCEAFLASIGGLQPTFSGTLRDIARLKPVSAAQLAECYGIGEAKVREYGEGLLAAVRDAVEATA